MDDSCMSVLVIKGIEPRPPKVMAAAGRGLLIEWVEQQRLRSQTAQQKSQRRVPSMYTVQ